MRMVGMGLLNGLILYAGIGGLKCLISERDKVKREGTMPDSFMYNKYKVGQTAPLET